MQAQSQIVQSSLRVGLGVRWCCSLGSPAITGGILMTFPFQLGVIGFASVQVSVDVDFDSSIYNWEIGFDGEMQTGPLLHRPPERRAHRRREDRASRRRI